MNDTIKNKENYFTINLLCKHPTLRGEDIALIFNIEPSWAKNVGERRTTPKGTLLEGCYTETIFCKRYEYFGLRWFFRATFDLIKSFEKYEKNIFSFNASGGKISIDISLINNNNIGDVASIDLLELAAKLKVEIGIEQFVDQNILRAVSL